MKAMVKDRNANAVSVWESIHKIRSEITLPWEAESLGNNEPFKDFMRR